MFKPNIFFILHIPPPVHGSSVVGKAIQDSQVINQSFDCRYINLGTSRTIDEIGENATHTKNGKKYKTVIDIGKQRSFKFNNYIFLSNAINKEIKSYFSLYKRIFSKLILMSK